MPFHEARGKLKKSAEEKEAYEVKIKELEEQIARSQK